MNFCICNDVIWSQEKIKDWNESPVLVTNKIYCCIDRIFRRSIKLSKGTNSFPVKLSILVTYAISKNVLYFPPSKGVGGNDRLVTPSLLSVSPTTVLVWVGRWTANWLQNLKLIFLFLQICISLTTILHNLILISLLV